MKASAPDSWAVQKKKVRSMVQRPKQHQALLGGRNFSGSSCRPKSMRTTSLSGSAFGRLPSALPRTSLDQRSSGGEAASEGRPAIATKRSCHRPLRAQSLLTTAPSHAMHFGGEAPAAAGAAEEAPAANRGDDADTAVGEVAPASTQSRSASRSSSLFCLLFASLGKAPSAPAPPAAGAAAGAGCSTRAAALEFAHERVDAQTEPAALTSQRQAASSSSRTLSSASVLASVCLRRLTSVTGERGERATNGERDGELPPSFRGGESEERRTNGPSSNCSEMTSPPDGSSSKVRRGRMRSPSDKEGRRSAAEAAAARALRKSLSCKSWPSTRFLSSAAKASEAESFSAKPSARRRSAATAFAAAAAPESRFLDSNASATPRRAASSDASSVAAAPPCAQPVSLLELRRAS